MKDKKWAVLTILAMTMFIIVIDTTIMNVSISALVEDLGTTVGGIQAAISLYALVMASFMLIGGFLTAYASWRWAFRLEVVIVIIVLLLSGAFKAGVAFLVMIALGGLIMTTGLSDRRLVDATDGADRPIADADGGAS